MNPNYRKSDRLVSSCVMPYCPRNKYTCRSLVGCERGGREPSTYNLSNPVCPMAASGLALWKRENLAGRPASRCLIPLDMTSSQLEQRNDFIRPQLSHTSHLTIHTILAEYQAIASACASEARDFGCVAVGLVGSRLSRCRVGAVVP